jgi:hypothetical protein
MKVGYTTWLGIEGLKAYIVANHLPIQRNNEGTSWYVFASDDGIIHETRIVKDSGNDQVDFEASFSSLTAPLQIRSAHNKPYRMAASAQPENSTERWKGFHLELSTEETTGTITIGFDNLVFLRGGVIYSDSCSNKDYLDVDIVWKEYPSMIIMPNFLQTIHMNKIVPISFLSAECMNFPPMLALQITYHKFDDGKERVISAITDFFEPNSF